MRVTAKLAKPERKRQDRSVLCATQRGRMTKVTRIRGPLRTHPSGLMKAARRPPQVTLEWQAKSGDITVIRQPTWGMSADIESNYKTGQCC